MKKHIIFLLIIFSCFFVMPNSVWAKEFKQINQTSSILRYYESVKKSQTYYGEQNKSDTYKLDNGDYLVSGTTALSRISSSGSLIWSVPINNVFYDITILGDYVYVGESFNPILKIRLSDGVVVKENDEFPGYKLVNDGTYIYAIFQNYIVKFDQNLNFVDEYNCSSDLSDGKISNNYSITIDNDYLYLINLVGTPYEYTYNDNQGNPHTATGYDYESRIVKLDMNLNKIDALKVNTYNLDDIGFVEPGSQNDIFKDNNGNLYLVDYYIIKVDKYGNAEMLYDPRPSDVSSNVLRTKIYTAGTIVGNYLVVGGLDITVSKNGISNQSLYNGAATLADPDLNSASVTMNSPAIRDLIPIVDVYDLNNKLIETHELKPDNESDNSFNILNISKTSNEGFLVKWMSTKENLENMFRYEPLSVLTPNNMSLIITEFGKVAKVKVNVKGLGKVRILNDDCACGEEVELVTTPKNGYYLKNIVVRDVNGKKITVKNNKFVMPCNGDVTVDAQFRKIVNPETSSIIIICILLGFMIVGSTIIVRGKIRHE